MIYGVTSMTVTCMAHYVDAYSVTAGRSWSSFDEDTFRHSIDTSSGWRRSIVVVAGVIGGGLGTNTRSSPEPISGPAGFPEWSGSRAITPALLIG